MTWYRKLLTALGILIAVGFGIAAGAWLFRPVHPEGLERSVDNQHSPVTSRAVDDKRAVQLTVTQGSEIVLSSASTGLVTDLACSPGSELTSGESALSVDGSPVFALATATPLWRELSENDTGEDVTALQTELQRLGYNTYPSGRVGPLTLRAVALLLGVTGQEAADFSTISPERFLWIPAPNVTVAQCHTQVGRALSPGDEIATLTKTLSLARISEMPKNLLAGEHVLSVGSVSLPIDEDGVVTDAAALNLLQQSPEYKAWTVSSKEHPGLPLSAQLTLKEPHEVHLVAPGAIYNISDTSGCVNDGGTARAVTIVSSELGQTFITFDDGQPAPKSVLMASETSPQCK
ncbi:peptidoglycan-binding domain-containing protein [Schaalia sp. ZJ1691]|uniref:peptidoglycan-binding domain-containing protein n=1 Tax=Schaalia sp. ZJ1691 TaxID=2709404 RepID=UPI0013EB2893|nr:peptidoglycan-binding domain-containing protein [Schaalia sp. ZJ1691]